MWKRSANLAMLPVLLTTGCPLDRAADRTLTIYQYQTTGSGTGPFTVDTSRLPADAVQRRIDDANSVETITVNQNYPVRVLLVPATQP